MYCIDYDGTEYTLDGIKLFYVDVEKEQWKLETLADLFELLNFTQAVIYCSSLKSANRVLQYLLSQNYNVCSILLFAYYQAGREDDIRGFRTGSFRIMVTTDGTPASHLDLAQISLVVSVDCPPCAESLVKIGCLIRFLIVYRCGRSGKFGRRGVHIIFVTKEEQEILHELYYETGREIEELPCNVAELL